MFKVGAGRELRWVMIRDDTTDLLEFFSFYFIYILVKYFIRVTYVYNIIGYHLFILFVTRYSII